MQQSTSGYFTYEKAGIIVKNIDKGKAGGYDYSSGLMSPILTEAFGIKMDNLGGDYWKYDGFLKQLLTSDCWWNLYKKTGSTYCQQMSQGEYVFALTFYNKYYAPVTFKDKKIQDLLKNVRTKGLAKPFGGSWTEIAASIKDRPNWSS